MKIKRRGISSGEGAVARALYWIAQASLSVLSKLYFRLTVDGLDNVPLHGAFVLAPVHRSNLDTLVMAVLPRRLRFMAKDSLWKSKVVGWLLSSLGGFPVNRDSPDRDSLTRAIELAASGEPVVLFPEGARQSGPTIQPLFDGAVYVAAKTGVPIVPVGVGGSERAMTKGSLFIRPVKIHLVIGEPIEPPASSDGGRVRRKAIKKVSEDLRETLQKLFDKAQIRAL